MVSHWFTYYPGEIRIASLFCCGWARNEVPVNCERGFLAREERPEKL
jgi:hypothetical protein